MISRSISATHGVAGERRLLFALIAVFVLFETILLATADHSCQRPGTECASQTDRYGFIVADSLLTRGFLVNPDDASEPFTGHPPGYGILMAATFSVFGSESYLPLIIVQLLMLIASGFLVRYATNSVLPGYGTLAMGLILFNPNILAHVNLPQTVAVELFLLTAAFAAAVRFQQTTFLRWAIICGAIVGAATMVRASAQLVLFSLPVVFVLLSVLSAPQRIPWAKAFGAAAGASLAAFLVVAPWALHQRAAGEGFRISSAGLEHLLLEDSLRYLTPGFRARFDPDAEVEYHKFETESLLSQYPEWDTKSAVERSQIRRAFVFDYYLSFPFRGSEFALALIKSWGTFLAGGGEGMIHRVLGMEFQPQKSPAIFYGTKGLAVGFSMVLRILGIIGIAAMFGKRDYPMLLLTAGLVTVYVLGPFLVGQPRYRVPVEPALAIMAVYGIAYLRSYLGRRRLTKGPN